METILVTGGAGFIGSYLADELLANGHRVRALDPLVDQVHGGSERPDYLAEDVELIVGDVRDRHLAREALDGVDAVVHLAARVGVGQSMYEIDEYVSANTHGTAVLLEALLDHPVRKLIVASSMSIYGEGLYAPSAAVERRRRDLEARKWDPQGAQGEEITPLPTPESKPCANSSVYALTKYDQERLCLVFGAAYDIPAVALRFFNVYGPRQALSNPYTGVLAIFASRLLNGRRPLVFEDGRQRRDFVNVRDVARACMLALERPDADGLPINVGSGRSVSVNEIADELAATLGTDLEAEVTGKYRVGDIRHCFADISRARSLLGFEPQVDLRAGLAEVAEWLETQTALDNVEDATGELLARGLAR
ncbi:MAG: NAD-dependent epimerase/dehydratase family protein [Gaiellaceae bacterium]